MKPLNSGWARFGRLLNSGWNWAPRWKSRPGISTASTRRPSGAGAGNDQALLLELGAELVVELIAVAVALVDLQPRRSTRPSGCPAVMRAGVACPGAWCRPWSATPCWSGIRSMTVVLALGGKLAGVGVGAAQHVAGVLHHRDLHAQADAEVGHAVLPGVPGGLRSCPRCPGRRSRRAPGCRRTPPDSSAQRSWSIRVSLSTHLISTSLSFSIAGVVQALHHATGRRRAA